MHFRFYWRTRQRFTIKRRAPDSISCYADTPMGVSFAFPEEFQSSWRQRYLDPWVLALAAWLHGRIYLGGRWHEHSACALKLPARDNSAHLALSAEILKANRSQGTGMTTQRQKEHGKNRQCRLVFDCSRSNQIHPGISFTVIFGRGDVT